jgi:hypothetical protein
MEVIGRSHRKTFALGNRFVLAVGTDRTAEASSVPQPRPAGIAPR